MENKKTFGNYIGQKRKELGLTQKGFAEKLYVSESAVSKWERGLSYPDISLIRDICAVLGVSEHELLTASEDTQTRNNERLANKYLRLIKRLKWTQIIIYGATLLTCFICNLAIQHTLSWFFIVLTAVMTAACLTLLPIVIEKQRGLITLGAFTLCLLLLLLVCNLYAGGDWWFPVAAVAVLFGLGVVFLPLVLKGIWLPGKLQDHKALLCLGADTALLVLLLLVSDWYTRGDSFFASSLLVSAFYLILPFGMLLIIRYARMNGFFKASGCLGLWAVMFYLSDGFLAMVLEGKPADFTYTFDFGIWNAETLDANVSILLFGLLLCLAVAFAVAGMVSALRKNR